MLKKHMLLQKKNKHDYLSKELEASAFILEDLPSLQMCKEKNLVVHTKGMHILYFAGITDCDTLGQSLCRSRITVCGFIKHGLPFVDYEHGLHKLFVFYSKFQRPRFSSRDALRIEELKIEDMNVSS